MFIWCTQSQRNQNKRKNTIKNILQENDYNTNLLDISLSQPQKQIIHEEPKHKKKKNGLRLHIAERQ
jgi:hypothetical protein